MVAIHDLKSKVIRSQPFQILCAIPNVSEEKKFDIVVRVEHETFDEIEFVKTQVN